MPAQFLYTYSLLYLIQLSAILLSLFLATGCNLAENQQNSQASADTLSGTTGQKVADTSLIRPAFPGGDVIQQNCELIQDQAETLLEEYYRPGVPANRLNEIIADLQQLDRQWKANDCQQVFGFMVPNLPRLPRPDKD